MSDTSFDEVLKLYNSLKSRYPIVGFECRGDNNQLTLRVLDECPQCHKQRPSVDASPEPGVAEWKAITPQLHNLVSSSTKPEFDVQISLEIDIDLINRHLRDLHQCLGVIFSIHRDQQGQLRLSSTDIGRFNKAECTINADDLTRFDITLVERESYVGEMCELEGHNIYCRKIPSTVTLLRIHYSVAPLVCDNCRYGCDLSLQ